MSKAVKSEWLNDKKERYKEMHNIKYEKELDIGSAAHIRVYRNRGKNLIITYDT